jgi:hypothetical protein
MDTPELFSVEYFCKEVREFAHLWTDVRAQGLGLVKVKVFANNDHAGDELRDLQRIRNILAAVDIVRAEQRRQADR